MKKTYYLTAAVVIVGLSYVFILPFFLKGIVERFLVKQAEKHLNTTYTVGDISIGMLDNFPKATVVVKNVVVGDSLLCVPRIKATVNAFSLIGGEVDVHDVLLKDGMLLMQSDAAGNSNWRVFKGSKRSVNRGGRGLSTNHKAVLISNLRFEDLDVVYRDEAHSVLLEAEDTDVHLDLHAEDTCLINVGLEVKDFVFQQGSVQWISNTKIRWNGDVSADFVEGDYHIKRSELFVNDLALDFKGGIQQLPDALGVDLEILTRNTEFRGLIDMLPSSLKTYLRKMEVDGSFLLAAKMKGEFRDSLLPETDVQLCVNNAIMCHKDFRDTINDINCEIRVYNPGGVSDSTSVSINNLTINTMGHPFLLDFSMYNPSSPYLKGKIEGTLDFDQLQRIFSVRSTLHGNVVADMHFSGKYAYIENEEYEKFNAAGEIVLKHIEFKSTSMPNGVKIPTGVITVSPNQLTLEKLHAQLKGSDFTLDGHIKNYFQHLFKNQTLAGDFNLNAKSINLNKIFQKSRRDRSGNQSGDDDAEDKVLYISRNIDVKFNAKIEEMILDKLQVSDIKGDIRLHEGIATLNNLRMNLLKGEMALTGNYYSPEVSDPKFDFGLKIRNLSLQEAYKSFTFVRKNIPVFKNSNGDLSSEMQFSGDLDKDMNVIFHTTNGEGFISSEGIRISNTPAFDKMASLLGNNEFRNLTIGALKADFTLENGNLTLMPFTTTVLENKATLSGKQYADGKMDYDIMLDIQRKYFGPKINKMMSKLPGSSSVSSLEVDININGKLNDPEVSADLSKAIKKVSKAAEKDLRNKLLRGIDDLFN